MTDNLTAPLVSPSTATLATDDIGGVHYPRTKLVHGADGVNDGDVSTANPLPVAGPLTDTQLRAAAVPVSGPLTDTQIRATALPVSGPVTDAQLRAAAVPVSIAATLPVSGPLTDTQLRAAAVPVSGPLTDAQIRATALPVSGPLTDTQLRAAAVPVSGPLTDAQIRATALPVSGPLTDAQLRATAIPTTALTDTQLRAAAVPVSGPLTDAQLRATAIPTTALTDTQLRASAVPVSIAATLKTTTADLAASTYNVAGVIAINTVLLTIDCLNLNHLSIQCISMGTTGVVTPEWSNDNTTWIAASIMTPAGVAAATFNAAGLWVTQRFARYLRLRLSTATTAGTTTINVQASADPAGQPVVQPVSGAVTVSGTATVSGTVTATVAAASLAIPGTIADVASAALTTTTTTAAFTPTSGVSYQVNIPVTAVTGTTPTLDVVVQESDDSGTNWFDVYHFPRITATGIYRSPKLMSAGNRVRYVQTVAGTTPSFTRAINRLQSSEAVDTVRQLFDRSLASTQALNVVTASLNVQNCRAAQLVITAGTITTTAPALQLEGTDDGANWYAIGAPLTAVANSTVRVVVPDTNSLSLRARVSTAGVAATLTHVIIKGF